ncbi:uncharacterized protein LOC119444132 isoform X2 [Dermacentor silvarum]|uniref:uncharacterized protein LOC119444132 isoform X2 n=1 Tax=Dermacentor silvarum TaxID=543639 RepID=UPI00189C1B50|nr:uncharacterized protein LOC119444132 isoform X2 [Dermacentor silvarum]
MKTSVALTVAVVLFGVFTEVTARLFTTDSACHRLRTKVEKVRRRCIYLCHMPEGYIMMAPEEDGTPCKRLVHEGVCLRGRCRRQRPRNGGPSTNHGSDNEPVPDSTTAIFRNE